MFESGPANLRVCPSCQRPNPPGRSTCWGCGATLPVTGPGPGAMPLPGGAGPAMGPGVPPGAPPAYWGTAGPRRSGGSAETGVLLMFVAFLISWVPVVGSVGGLLLLIGFILVYTGRHDYGERFRRFVVLGSNLLFAAVVEVVLELVALLLLILTRSAPTFNAQYLIVAGLAIPAATGLASLVFVVYGAADRRTRLYLWSAFGAGLAALGGFAFLSFSGDLTSLLFFDALSGTGVALFTLINAAVFAVPYLLFALAYARVRRVLIAGDLSALG